MHSKKAAIIAFSVVLLSVAAVSASEKEADEWISGLERLFQDYEDGKISYLTAWLEFREMTRGTQNIADEDIERLDLELVDSKPFELHLEGETTKKDVIYINVDGSATKCEVAETFGSGVRRYVCDFTLKNYRKTIFDGNKSSANMTVQTELDFKMQGGNYGGVLFRKINKAYLGEMRLPTNVRLAVEESFPGFAKAICGKNAIIGVNDFAMLNREIESASRTAVRHDPNYSFRLINDSHHSDTETMECRIAIEESAWKEQKLYECGLFAKYADEYPPGEECKVQVREGGVQKEYGCRDYKLYQPYKTEECQTEISTKIPSPKISFKMRMKKQFMENAFGEAWEKMKEKPFEKPVKMDPEAAKKLKALEGQAGGLVTSMKIHNETSSLLELTLYIKKMSLRMLSPNFLKTVTSKSS